MLNKKREQRRADLCGELLELWEIIHKALLQRIKDCSASRNRAWRDFVELVEHLPGNVAHLCDNTGALLADLGDQAVKAVAYYVDNARNIAFLNCFCKFIKEKRKILNGYFGFFGIRFID